MTKCLAAATAALTLFAWSSRTDAQMSHALRLCGDPELSVDIRISACTVVIQSGHETPRNLAAAYNNRGSAYVVKGDPDRAM